MNKETVSDVHEVTEWFIHKAKEGDDNLTQLKLHKILYFAQGWHLAYNEKPLFNTNFEAWRFGPVIRTLYNQYKVFGNKAICPESDDFEPRFDKNTQDFLNTIYETYGTMDSTRLVSLSHDPNGPWHKHYRPNVLFNDEIIPKREIRDYFVSLKEKAEQ